jgi:hypothetical protein
MLRPSLHGQWWTITEEPGRRYGVFYPPAGQKPRFAFGGNLPFAIRIPIPILTPFISQLRGDSRLRLGRNRRKDNTPYNPPGLKRIMLVNIFAKRATIFRWSGSTPAPEANRVRRARRPPGEPQTPRKGYSYGRVDCGNREQE